MSRNSIRAVVLGAALTLAVGAAAAPAQAKTVKPKIKSVKFYGPASEPTVVVTGVGLGSLPIANAEPAAQCFETEDTGYDFTEGVFKLEDTSRGWTAGEGPGDCIGVTFKVFTETEVVFYLGSAYSQYEPIQKKDNYTLVINGLTKSGLISIKK